MQAMARPSADVPPYQRPSDDMANTSQTKPMARPAMIRQESTQPPRNTANTTTQMETGPVPAASNHAPHAERQPSQATTVLQIYAIEIVHSRPASNEGIRKYISLKADPSLPLAYSDYRK